MALLAALSLPLGFTDPSLAEVGSSVRQNALQLPPLPCGGVAAAVCGLGPSEPCYYDAACDDSSLLGCNAGGVGARCRFCGFGEYDSIPCPEAISTAHGDPLFKRNTTQKKFWMPLKEPVILMSWQALEPKETLELSGQAYETPTTHDQWFDSFALTSNGKQVFNVSSGFSHLGTVRLSLDGTAVGLTDERKSGAVNFTSVRSPITLELTKLPERLRIGTKRAQKLTVRMSNGFAFSVYSAKAAKFENATTQVKYVHLNVRLDSGIPAGATGVVPELAGVVSMASSTKAMLKDQQTSQVPDPDPNPNLHPDPDPDPNPNPGPHPNPNLNSDLNQDVVVGAQKAKRRVQRAQLNLVQLQAAGNLVL
jgi:hypothetical protein